MDTEWTSVGSMVTIFEGTINASKLLLINKVQRRRAVRSIPREGV
jgi:hypothetical protein